MEEDPTRYSAERPYVFFYNEKDTCFCNRLSVTLLARKSRLPRLKVINNGAIANDQFVKYPEGLLPDSVELHHASRLEWVQRFKQTGR